MLKVDYQALWRLPSCCPARVEVWEKSLSMLADAPPLDDPGAFEAWRDALIARDGAACTPRARADAVLIS
jgi:hypothetical protein